MLNIPLFPDLAGKTALITGGSGGIGAETARWFAHNGVQVTIAGRDRSRIEHVRASLAAISAGHAAIELDCTSADQLEAARTTLIERQGGLDILIAFAGGGTSRPAPIEQDWRSSLDNNVTATFLTLRTFAADLKKSGRGAAVTMASTAGRAPSAAPLGYAVAKAGIVLLTQQLAQDLGPDGVRVNCISPSAVLTDRTAEHMPPQMRQKIADAHPLRRLGTPADIAAATLFLASESAGWLTGATLDIAGGRLMH
ncbi:3-oxoacyl-[acyl-carrier protein] reductase [Rhizobium pisi]|uniref:3-oxoacyl-[acyl-carrier protein] reductase n=1 Tax=Rhizobium pisi TaxID=574561 RepID=A0A427MAF6_9HYPH|nr:SDR family NAD(P)-dependent oxidoreductase [Rhizobium pisi]MBB3138311.1 3-oxoacyl-[acyl-carrier protein] reductase [Rhizobium pisi]RSB63445.1 SDR family oxidoreductase [Rhizobium pisi]TCA43467.1 SDR family oxidoreductase [Rhizobium pisi]